jgi:hypothetical protein
MATTTVNVGYEGYVDKTYSTGSAFNWVTLVRDAVTGTSATTVTSAQIDVGTQSYYLQGRFTYIGGNSRSFFFFDTSGVGGTITAAYLHIYGEGTTNSVDTQLVEASAWGGGGDTTTLSTGDYDAVTFGTVYSPVKISWVSGAYNTYALNGTAITAMNNDGYLNTALLTQDYDIGAFGNGTSPTLGDTWAIETDFANGANPQYLEITYTPSGYGNYVNGVASDQIGSVNGVATASIGSINGV